MHAKPDLRVLFNDKIFRSGSVIVTVIWLGDRMAKFISGCVAGSLLTIVALTLFAGLLYSRAERQLIDDWRKIQPGMNRESVLQTLGEPAYDMKLGDGFPAWAEQSVPDDYYKTHALLVFYVPAPGPQLLLVYLDENGDVSFVSSIYT